MVIEVPPKVWQPKVVNKYRMPEYEDVDNGVFEFQSCENRVFCDVLYGMRAHVRI